MEIGSILGITDDDLIARFRHGLGNVGAISLACGYPTKASAPHIVRNGFNQLLALAVATDLSFKEAEKVRVFNLRHLRLKFYHYYCGTYIL